MITFIASLVVPADKAEAFETLMTSVRDLTREHEAGVLYYDFGKSADEPDRYAVIEVYRDADAHAAHMETAWVRDSIPATRRLIEGRIEVRQFVSPGTEPATRRMRES